MTPSSSVCHIALAPVPGHLLLFRAWTEVARSEGHHIGKILAATWLVECRHGGSGPVWTACCQQGLCRSSGAAPGCKLVPSALGGSDSDLDCILCLGHVRLVVVLEHAASPSA